MSYLAEFLTHVADLKELRDALVREQTIREVMADTGLSREEVTRVADETEAIDREMIDDLTEGQPTTLEDALSRYVERIPEVVNTAEGDVSERIADDLYALLAHPWPGPCGTSGDVTRLRVDVR